MRSLSGAGARDLFSLGVAASAMLLFLGYVEVWREKLCSERQKSQRKNLKRKNLVEDLKGPMKGIRRLFSSFRSKINELIQMGFGP